MGRAARRAVATPALALALYAPPAEAQVAVSATAINEYRLRGYSISEGHPAAEAVLSYDGASGIYANASVTGVLDPDTGPELLGATGNVGYAKRLGSGPVLDVGVVHTEYTSHSLYGRAADYSEIYVGLAGKHLSSRIFFSPNYLRSGVETIYADVEGVVHVAPSLRLTGHLGILAQVGGPRYPYKERTQYDVRIGAAKRFGSLEVHAAWTAGGPDREYYAGRSHSRNAFVFGATYVF